MNSPFELMMDAPPPQDFQPSERPTTNPRHPLHSPLGWFSLILLFVFIHVVAWAVGWLPWVLLAEYAVAMGCSPLAFEMSQNPKNKDIL